MQPKSPFPTCQQIAGNAHSRYWKLGDYNLLLGDLLAFLRTTLSSKCLPFEIDYKGETRRATFNPEFSHNLDWGDAYFYAIPGYMSIVIPGYAYSPLLDLFHSCFQQHPWLRYCAFLNPNATLSEEPMLEAEVLNDFVQMLRTHARQESTSLHMRKWKNDTERSQTDAITEYVPELLSQADRLDPIRVDFQYQGGVFSLTDAMPYGKWVGDSVQWTYVPVHADSPSDNAESRARIDPRVAMHDRARFFRNIYRGPDSQVFQYLRGYICKMERGEDGAYHIHCCFFLDAKRPAYLTIDIVIAAISSRWLRVTQGRGLVFNCHEESYRQKLIREGRWDLDPLAGRDQRQVKRLTDYLVRYFARDKDQSIHIKPTVRSRALTMATGRTSTVGAPASRYLTRH